LALFPIRAWLAITPPPSQPPAIFSSSNPSASDQSWDTLFSSKIFSKSLLCDLSHGFFFTVVLLWGSGIVTRTLVPYTCRNGLFTVLSRFPDLFLFKAILSFSSFHSSFLFAQYSSPVFEFGVSAWTSVLRCGVQDFFLIPSFYSIDAHPSGSVAVGKWKLFPLLLPPMTFKWGLSISVQSQALGCPPPSLLFAPRRL